ncbi:hypothetical protein HPP92_024285 [Vanilla planifolia]|uniref:Uncharacterized protein n=1 Tax=Vanilla planifolia TaxID=51239 RepID=A0A835PRX3_VANPL|nr:hypothetical protein HPP92_024285 [Vanilla planifolia]
MVPTSSEQQQQHTMHFPGGGPPSASSSNASTPKLLLLPGPAVPTSPCVQPLAAAAADICAPSYGTMARPLPASFESIGETGGKRDDALVAAGSPWKTESRGWIDITTDLALATPSPYR